MAVIIVTYYLLLLLLLLLLYADIQEHILILATALKQRSLISKEYLLFVTLANSST